MAENQINSLSQARALSVNQVSQAFKSKTDFMHYFKTNLQLYTPPTDHMTKEWLKSILAGQKHLLKLSELKPVNVGNFQEVSVKHLYDEFSKRQELSMYFPDKIPKGKQIDREYFFNIVNTICNEELQAIIQHAHVQRNSVEEEDQQKESIMMSAEMADAMFKFPFISKCKGRTVHLLKMKSKSQKIMKPRKTYGVLDKSSRPKNQTWSATKVRHMPEEDAEMRQDQAQQRKKIQPTIIEQFNKPDGKK